jgi:hypothetical protein
MNFLYFLKIFVTQHDQYRLDKLNSSKISNNERSPKTQNGSIGSNRSGSNSNELVSSKLKAPTNGSPNITKNKVTNQIQKKFDEEELDYPKQQDPFDEHEEASKQTRVINTSRENDKNSKSSIGKKRSEIEENEYENLNKLITYDSFETLYYSDSSFESSADYYANVSSRNNYSIDTKATISDFRTQFKDEQNKMSEKSASEFFYCNEHELSLDNTNEKENLTCLKLNEKLYQNISSFDLKMLKFSQKYD